MAREPWNNWTYSYHIMILKSNKYKTYFVTICYMVYFHLFVKFTFIFNSWSLLFHSDAKHIYPLSTNWQNCIAIYHFLIFNHFLFSYCQHRGTGLEHGVSPPLTQQRRSSASCCTSPRTGSSGTRTGRTSQQTTSMNNAFCMWCEIVNWTFTLFRYKNWSTKVILNQGAMKIS